MPNRFQLWLRCISQTLMGILISAKILYSFGMCITLLAVIFLQNVPTCSNWIMAFVFCSFFYYGIYFIMNLVQYVLYRDYVKKNTLEFFTTHFRSEHRSIFIIDKILDVCSIFPYVITVVIISNGYCQNDFFTLYCYIYVAMILYSADWLVKVIQLVLMMIPSKLFGRIPPNVNLYVSRYDPFGATTQVAVVPECAICITEDPNMKFVKINKCKHIFHEACIESWLIISATCPLCRVRLTEENAVIRV